MLQHGHTNILLSFVFLFFFSVLLSDIRDSDKRMSDQCVHKTYYAFYLCMKWRSFIVGNYVFYLWKLCFLSVYEMKVFIVGNYVFYLWKLCFLSVYEMKVFHCWKLCFLSVKIMLFIQLKLCFLHSHMWRYSAENLQIIIVGVYHCDKLWYNDFLFIMILVQYMNLNYQF